MAKAPLSPEQKAKKLETNRRWRARNKDKENARHAARRKKHPTYASDKALQAKYGITAEQRDALLTSQDFLCAICKTSTPGGTNAQFHVDHCHSSKRVRGMLCHGCNVGLGHFKDNPQALRLAADYIEKHQ